MNDVKKIPNRLLGEMVQQKRVAYYHATKKGVRLIKKNKYTQRELTQLMTEYERRRAKKKKSRVNKKRRSNSGLGLFGVRF